MKQAKMTLSQSTMNLDFVKKVEKLSGSSVRRCFQCGKCSAGSPMRSFMEHPPDRIVRLLQLGQYERVLAGRSTWYCASCETCTTRCPNKVDLAAIMDALRKLSWDADGPVFTARQVKDMRPRVLGAESGRGRSGSILAV